MASCGDSDANPSITKYDTFFWHSSVFVSIRFYNRSLVQIKSHAQKVLKRLEAGENVFRRLDENYAVVNQLILQAAEEQLSGNSSSGCLSAEAKRKRTTAAKLSLPSLCPSSHSVEGCVGDRVIAETSMESKHQNTATIHGTRTDVETPSIQNANSNISEHRRGAVIAAAALCQLSAIGGAWDNPASGSLQESCWTTTALQLLPGLQSLSSRQNMKPL